MNDIKPKIFFKESRNAVKQTNWYVITGGPGSGKTATIDFRINKSN